MHGFLKLAIVGSVMFGAAACERSTSAPPARPAPMPAQTTYAPPPMQQQTMQPQPMPRQTMPQQRERDTSAQLQTPPPLDMCPMEVEGVRLNVTDIDSGIALVFTTMTGDVADLRQRVRLLAEAHAQKGGFVASDALLMDQTMQHKELKRGMHKGELHQQGGMTQGEMQQGGTIQGDVSQGDLDAGIIPSDVMTVDIDNGVRLEFRPEHPAQIADLRPLVQRSAQRLARGMCPRPVDIEARR